MNILNEKIKFVKVKESTVFLYTAHPSGFWCAADAHIFSDLKPNTLYRVENNQFIEHIEVPPKDARVLVRDTKDAPWLPRYSAGRTDRDGWLLCYSNGGTSWTSKSVAPFKYRKLPEEDQQ